MHNVLCHFSFLFFISKEILIVHHAPALKQQPWKDLNISAAGSHLCKPAYMGKKLVILFTVFCVYYTYHLVADHFTQNLDQCHEFPQLQNYHHICSEKTQFLCFNVQGKTMLIEISL